MARLSNSFAWSELTPLLLLAGACLLESGTALDITNMTASVSDYLAAERTYLAWIRTSLALVGFGIAFTRLDKGVYIGGPTIIIGAAFLLIATYRYFDVVHMLKHGRFTVDRSGPMWAAAMTGTLIFLAVLLVIFSAIQEWRTNWKAKRRATQLQQEQEQQGHYHTLPDQPGLGPRSSNVSINSSSSAGGPGRLGVAVSLPRMGELESDDSPAGKSDEGFSASSSSDSNQSLLSHRRTSA